MEFNLYEKQNNKNDILIIVLCFISMLFIIQLVSGLTANSSNYSVGSFGTGLVSSNASSDNYQAVFLSESPGTTRNGESDSYTTNVGFFDNTPYYRGVSITSYSIYPKSTVPGSIIRLSLSALNSESVWAVLTLPDNTQETISMNNNQYSYYTADLIGQYTVVFYANNSQGNLASVIDTFDITSPVIPPSGGGGTRTIIEKCTYVWDCTSWSICSDKEQERVCNNIGNCTGTEGKPLEMRECSDALFDVVMGLNEIEITQNKTLKFGINLTETKGIEKIDVQIKYSIIDNNNTEIFSQIETRAIQGNLTYEKEIKDINLESGKYILRVDILYGNLQRAFAEQNFEVIKGNNGREKPKPEGIGSLFEKLNYKVVLLYVLLICGLIFVLWMILLIFKKLKRERTLIKQVPKRTKLRLITKIKEILRNIKNVFQMEYSEDTISSLLNKKVYSSGGNFIGEVREVILGKNNIHSLKILLDKKYDFIGKGIIVDYKNVKSIKDVVILDEEVLSILK